MALTHSRRPPDPQSTDSVMLVSRHSCDLVRVDRLLNHQVLGDIDDSFLDSSLRTELDELLVAAGEVALLIQPSGSNAVGPRSFHSRLLLVAVFFCAVVLLDNFKVRLRTVLFQSTHPSLFLHMNEVLEMYGPLFPLL